MPCAAFRRLGKGLMSYFNLSDLPPSGRSIKGTYGKSRCPCTIFVYGAWYAVKGSVRANKAAVPGVLREGVWVELVSDDQTVVGPETITRHRDLVDLVGR